MKPDAFFHPDERGEKPIVSSFPCTGMHGGKLYLRSDCENARFPPRVTVHPADAEEIAALRTILLDYCAAFAYDIDMILQGLFTAATPDTANPYRQMYEAN